MTSKPAIIESQSTFLSNSISFKMFGTRQNMTVLRNILYSRTSVARTLMARIPRLLRTRSWVPLKDLG